MTIVMARKVAAVSAPTWNAAWSDALAELELGVEEIEAALRAGHSPAATTWQPPTNLGQLPAPLRDRAQALVNRQLHAARALAEAAEHSRRHLQVLDQVRATPEAAPVYLDTAG
ncbi:hypothetical protein [Pengzhenrongella frigida]|uniref:Flagellar protein FlgN n=1 Tax=Pengzhenrongella frigida TaxID=1259133 RepID=A0A4Q5N0K9_9MICO|nr:hypothetical protein [Cellulomonas sp. HLT2-17]RYV50027.1 hypothetical protein EUA98_15790 [Cellulomonas sp. HLT2-17]